MATLPLFPLSTVLLPGGRLPLQIFELRYLDLMLRCWREGQPFGVVALEQGHEVQTLGPDGRYAPQQWAAMGTAAELLHLERVHPGLLVVLAEGRWRFRVRSSERRPNGLWVADIDALPADMPMPVPAELAPVVAQLRQLLQGTRERLRQRHPGDTTALQTLPNPDDPRWTDCGWTANRGAEWLPLPLAERQRLLETDSPLLRLELVGDWLERLGLR